MSSTIYEALSKASSTLDFKTYGKKKYNLDFQKYVAYYGPKNADAAYHAQLITDYIMPDFFRAVNCLITGEEDVTVVEKSLDKVESILAKVHKTISKLTPKKLKKRFERAVEISPFIAWAVVPYEFIFSKPTREGQLSYKELSNLLKQAFFMKRTSTDPMLAPIASFSPIAFFALKQTEIAFAVGSKLLNQVGKEVTGENTGTAYFVTNKSKFPYSLFNTAENFNYSILRMILSGYGGIAADPFVSGMVKVLKDSGFEGIDPTNILAHIDNLMGKPVVFDGMLKPIVIPFAGTQLKVLTTPSSIKADDYIDQNNPQPPAPPVDPVDPVDPPVDPVQPPVDPVVPPVDEFAMFTNAELLSFAQDVYSHDVMRLKDILYVLACIAMAGKVFENYIAKGIPFAGISLDSPELQKDVLAAVIGMVYGNNVPSRVAQEILSMSPGLVLYASKVYSMIYDPSVTAQNLFANMDRNLVLKNFFLVKTKEQEYDMSVLSKICVDRELTQETFNPAEFAQSLEKLMISRNIVDVMETFEEFIARLEAEIPVPPPSNSSYEGIPEPLRNVMATIQGEQVYSVPMMFDFVQGMVAGQDQKLKSILYTVAVYAIAMRSMNFLTNGVSVLGIDPITQLEMQDGSMIQKVQTMIGRILWMVNGTEPTQGDIQRYMGDTNMQNYISATVPTMSNGTFDEVSANYILVQFFIVKMVELSMNGGDVNMFAGEFDAICLGKQYQSASDIDPATLLAALNPIYNNKQYITETFQEYVDRISAPEQPA
jgi:hypothetical protein